MNQVMMKEFGLLILFVVVGPYLIGGIIVLVWLALASLLAALGFPYLLRRFEQGPRGP